MTQPIEPKPYEYYFNHFYLPDSDQIEIFESRFLYSCEKGLDQLVYRFTEHPTYEKMRGEIKQRGFTLLSSRRSEDTPEKIQKIFLEACQSGCHEVVTPLLANAKKTNDLSTVFIYGFDLASKGYQIAPAHLRDRFTRTLEAISESDRCHELSDEQLVQTNLASPLLRERHRAITSTNRALEQLSHLMKIASPCPPSTTSASPLSISP